MGDMKRVTIPGYGTYDVHDPDALSGTDTTLSVAGKAADAAAVGTALASKAPAIESPSYPGCYYRVVGGKIEWLNPPMVLDVEYRTTERFNGKPVYVRMTDFGALPNAGSSHISLSNVFAEHVIYAGGTLTNSGYGNAHIPYGTGPTYGSSFGNVSIYARPTGTSTVIVIVTTTSDLSSAWGQIILKYTKKTD